MAEGLLRHKLAEAGVDARVGSAGLFEDDGRPASEDGVTVMAAIGIDTSGHLSRHMTPEMLVGADLIIGMAREHVREAVLASPDIWTRTYTLKELVRRGTDVGPRSAGQPLDEWLAKVHAGRTRNDLLGSSEIDDVADPIGQPLAVYEQTAAELDRLTTRVTSLVKGS